MTLAPNGRSESTNPVMNVFKIPDAIADKYQGAGYALAASANGEIVALKYIRDIFPQTPEMLDYNGVAHLLGDARIAPTVREFSALGDVHVGMCSAWEFVEL